MEHIRMVSAGFVLYYQAYTNDALGKIQNKAFKLWKKPLPTLQEVKIITDI